MTAARHATPRRWQPLTWLRAIVAGIELRLAGPREDEAATEWLSRTGRLSGEAEHVADVEAQYEAVMRSIRAGDADAYKHLAAMAPEDSPRAAWYRELAVDDDEAPWDEQAADARIAVEHALHGPTDPGAATLAPEAATDSPRSDAASTLPQPESPAPPGLGQHPFDGDAKRDTWVTWQGAPGSPLGFTPSRRPATTPFPALITAPQPALSASEALGIVGRVYQWPPWDPAPEPAPCGTGWDTSRDGMTRLLHALRTLDVA